jgi:hypothetical protein
MSKRPIDRALEWAKDDGLNQSELAKKAGVLPQDITNWKKRDLPSDKYVVMADALNRSIDDLLGRAGYRRGDVVEVATSGVPPAGYVRLEHLSPRPSMGKGALIAEPVQIVQYLDVLEQWVRQNVGSANPDRIKVLTGNGHSMEPTIKDHDLVFVDVECRAIEGPGIYVLDVADRFILKKAMILSDGTLIIRSDNVAEYPDEERHDLRRAAETILVCGKVLAWWTLRKG